MKQLWLLPICVLCFSLVAAAADNDDKAVTMKASLVGVTETPPTASTATGSFSATENPDGTFSFTETFSGLAANVSQSHIHFGFPKVGGGVMIFLCGGGGQPACPAAMAGTVTGTFGAANVVGPTVQGVAAGDFATAIRLVLHGAGYVNIHDSVFPAGEIRGQVHVRFGDHDRDDHDRD
jgi:hypothetical protein